MAQSCLADEDFKTELLKSIPHLRAFSRSLCNQPDIADDLVQDTLMKAWAARARFTAGTNMRAWTFVILRNSFLSHLRRNKHTLCMSDDMLELTVSISPNQDHSLELEDLQRALMALPANQRKAVVLVGAGGFIYEEVAKICNCPVGTIKSRVARGRTALEKMFKENTISKRKNQPPMKALLAQLN